MHQNKTSDQLPRAAFLGLTSKPLALPPHWLPLVYLAVSFALGSGAVSLAGQPLRLAMHHASPTN